MAKSINANPHYGLIIAATLLIATVGYGVMHLMVYVLPMSQDSMFSNLIFTLFIIALGLAVPYWMLKFSIHRAHLYNPQEKEIRLEDLPKDQERAQKW
jgi:hypothetical protein